MVDRGQDFSKKMDALLKTSKVDSSIVTQAISAVATKNHSYDPLSPDAPDQFIINHYWRRMIDSQTPMSRRVRRFKKDYRD